MGGDLRCNIPGILRIECVLSSAGMVSTIPTPTNLATLIFALDGECKEVNESRISANDDCVRGR